MHHLSPHFILEKFEQGLVQGQFQAVSLFVDISGFTTVTETLLQHGQHGAEVLARVMVSIFTPLVQTVYQHGGFISNFAGDAFTALFPITTDAEHILIHRRALAAAQSLGQQMAGPVSQTTPYGTFNFTAKIGLAGGAVEWGILAGVEPNQHAYYFKGSAVEQCVRAEHYAGGGEIIVSRAVYNLLENLMTATPVNKNNNFLKVTEVSGTFPAPQPIALPSITLQQAAAFHPPDLLTQTTRGEFRYALNLFVNFSNIKTRLELTGLMQHVFKLQKQYGGFLNRVDFGDKGCHLLLFWGAPIAYENDIERALNFILDLKAAAEFPMRAGLTYQISHAGFIGASLREEYTCYGRGVNLAARFMTAAPWGEIWLDEKVAQQARDEFNVEFIDNMSFKGFVKKEAVFRLNKRRIFVTDPAYQQPLVGRQTELAQLTEAIEPIFQGQFAGVVTIHGEAGMGKSRLLYELHQQLTDNPSARLRWFHCHTDEILRQPLNPFRYWLRTYFGQSPTQTEAQNKRQFNQTLNKLLPQVTDPAIQSELERTRSFLGTLVDLYWPDSLYERLDPKLRFENTLQALKNLVKAESLIQPVIIELEDSHWLDPASIALVKVLTRHMSAYPVAIILTCRYRDDGSKFTLIPDEAVAQAEIELSQLSPPEIKTIVERILQSKIADQALNFLAKKSGGNPFFIEQLVLDLRERELFSINDDVNRSTFARLAIQPKNLPTTITSVLTSRLDRLPTSLKQVIQTASVLGAEFEFEILAHMLPAEQNLNRAIKQAETEQIWSRVGQTRLSFKHMLLRDSAYTMQLRHRLQELHQLAATAYEQLYTADLSRHYDTLAYHYEQAKIIPKAKTYLKKAGDRAKANYQNQAALSLYQRLLNYVPDANTKTEIYYEQAEIYDLLGQWDSAIATLNNGLAKAKTTNNLQMEARLRIMLGDVWRKKGNYELALTQLEKAKTIAENIGDKRLLAKTLSMMAGSYSYRLETNQALALSQQSLAISTEIGDQLEVAAAKAGIGFSYFLAGNTAPALPYLLQAISLFKTLGDKVRLIPPLFNMGAAYHHLGDYEQALTCFQRVMVEAREIGDIVGIWLGLHYTGLTHHSQGEHQQAIFYLRESIKTRAELGNDGLLIQTRPYLATAYAGLGKHAPALETALQYFEHTNQTGRDTEQGRAHLAVALVLTQLEKSRETRPAKSGVSQNIVDSLGDPSLQNLIKQISQITQLAPNPAAFFNHAIKAAQQDRPYRLTLIPALYQYGKYLYCAGQTKKGLQKLTEAKAQALPDGMMGKVEQIKRVCTEIGVNFESL